MKINKMSTEDLRAAIALHKQNRFSKYFKDLCAELNARKYKAGFFNADKILSYQSKISARKTVLKGTLALANPELL